MDQDRIDKLQDTNFDENLLENDVVGFMLDQDIIEIRDAGESLLNEDPSIEIIDLIDDESPDEVPALY